ncbi:MAG TPA: co-chaperone GroES [Planctomycetota bacterium]|jgi:chaperonin GroES|nr:co-chaperone GroES [Planctomycetota bacterium]
MLRIRPLDDRVVIQVLEAEEKTTGGIVIPDTAKEKPQRGKVRAVGPGRLLKTGKRESVPVGVGEEVLFGKYAGTDVRIEGEEYKVLHGNEILASLGR